jgi:hypothetical protein
MSKAQKTLAAMGWDIGQDESGDDDAGVFVIRAGDENGDSYIAFNHSDLEELNEAFNNYHANRTGFSRGQRDDERHDLDTPAQVWGLKINGKVWSKGGKDVTFTSKQAALNTRNAILKNKPDLEIGLVTRGGLAEKIDSRFRKTEWIPIADALKILKHYGATIEEWGGHFHFAYYDREGVRKRIEDLTWNADDTRNVRLSILNQAVRELKAQKQGMAEEKIKGADGKACWPGYRYNGTTNGKDDCVKVKVKESSIMQGVSQLDEDWKKKLGAAALAGSMALGSAGAQARVTPDGQGGFTGGMKPSATVVAPDNTPSATPPTASSDTSDPLKGLARADSADRQAKTINVGGKEYGLVELSPTDIRPRGGQRIVVPQAVLGERGIGNYMGILVGDRVFVISKN